MWDVKLVFTLDVAGNTVVYDNPVVFSSGKPYSFGRKQISHIQDASFEEVHFDILPTPNGITLNNRSAMFGVYERVPYNNGSFIEYDKNKVKGLLIGNCYLDFNKSTDMFTLYYKDNQSAIKQTKISSPYLFTRQYFDNQPYVSSNHASVSVDEKNVYISDGTSERGSFNGTWVGCDKFDIVNPNVWHYFRVSYDLFLFIIIQKKEIITFDPEPNLHNLLPLEEENQQYPAN
jgi:hypothetical protein